MEEKLLKLFKLVDKLSEKQDKIFASLEYHAKDNKKLEVTIRDKKDYTTIEKIEVYLDKISVEQLNISIKLLEKYILGGAINE